MCSGTEKAYAAPPKAAQTAAVSSNFISDSLELLFVGYLGLLPILYLCCISASVMVGGWWLMFWRHFGLCSSTCVSISRRGRGRVAAGDD
jgi:hypothetical protein